MRRVALTRRNAESRTSPLSEHFEDQIEELYQRDPDRHIDRDLQPPPRLLRPAQQVGYVVRRLVQGVGQLLKMLRRSPHLFRDSGHRHGRFRHLLPVPQLEFHLAGRPPRAPRRAVIHPLPDFLIRPAPQQLHQRLHPLGRIRFGSLFRCSYFVNKYWHPSQPTSHLPSRQIPEVHLRPRLSPAPHSGNDLTPCPNSHHAPQPFETSGRGHSRPEPPGTITTNEGTTPIPMSC